MSGSIIVVAILAVKAVILYFTWSIVKPIFDGVKAVMTNASVVTSLFFCLFMAFVGYMDWKVNNSDYNGGEKEKE